MPSVSKIRLLIRWIKFLEEMRHSRTKIETDFIHFLKKTCGISQTQNSTNFHGTEQTRKRGMPDAGLMLSE